MMYNFWNPTGYQPQYYGMNNGAMPDQLAQMRALQQLPQQQPQSNSGLIWVQGEAGAKSYLVSPGSTVMLMDSENTVFYLKSSDASGMPLPLRIFDYSERRESIHTEPEPAQQNSPAIDPKNYVTRKEFDDFIESLSNKNTTE